MEVKRSSDFRYVFSNAFGLQLGSNEVTIKFGFVEDVSKPQDITELVGVIVTHQTLKLIGLGITDVVAQFEKTNNTIIAIDPSKLAELAKNIEQGLVKSPTAPTA